MASEMVLTWTAAACCRFREASLLAVGRSGMTATPKSYRQCASA